MFAYTIQNSIVTMLLITLCYLAYQRPANQFNWPPAPVTPTVSSVTIAPITKKSASYDESTHINTTPIAIHALYTIKHPFNGPMHKPIVGKSKPISTAQSLKQHAVMCHKIARMIEMLEQE